MSRPGYGDIFMDLAILLSRRSTCSRMSVGCVVVSSDNHRVLSIGYNGGPRGLSNECLSDKPGQCGHIHAEVNALLKMDYNDPAEKHMYVTVSPCYMCAVAIINSGIRVVTYLKEYRETSGLDLLGAASVECRHLNHETGLFLQGQT